MVVGSVLVAPGSRAQQLPCRGLVALWHVGSSWIMDPARVSWAPPTWLVSNFLVRPASS